MAHYSRFKRSTYLNFEKLRLSVYLHKSIRIDIVSSSFPRMHLRYENPPEERNLARRFGLVHCPSLTAAICHAKCRRKELIVTAECLLTKE